MVGVLDAPHKIDITSAWKVEVGDGDVHWIIALMKNIEFLDSWRNSINQWTSLKFVPPLVHLPGELFPKWK